MFDPKDSGSRAALHDKVGSDFEALRPFREQMRTYVERTLPSSAGVGSLGRGGRTPLPDNKLAQFVGIMLQLLVPHNPAASVTTKSRDKKAAAYDLELALTEQMRLMQFSESLYDVVCSALYMMGVGKVALEDVDIDMPGGWTQRANLPFFQPISMDDWIQDMRARSWATCRLMGDRYLRSLESVREDERFDPRVREHVSEIMDPLMTSDGGLRLESFTTGRQGSRYSDDFVPMVELEDIYLPQSRQLVTKPVDSPEILRVVQWDGPVMPYHRLSFMRLPQQTMPFSPVAEQLDMHLIVNMAWNKLAQQAARSKTLTVVPEGEDKDANRIRDASDGEMIPLRRPESSREIKFGGPDPALFAFGLQASSIFNRSAGNLDALGGLGAQSDTATQDKLIHGAAGKKAEWFSHQVTKFTRNVLRDLAWYMWTDPVSEIPISKSTAGGRVTIEKTWGPEDRQGEYLDYEIDVDPYSMSDQTPGGRANTLMSFWQNIIAPNLAALAEVGAMPDIQALVRLMARYLNMSELEEVIRFTDGSANMAGGDYGPETPAPRGGKQATRTYERVSRSSPESMRQREMDGLMRMASAQE